MTAESRTWRYPRLPAGDWTFITLCGWAALLAIVPAILLGIDHFSAVAEVFGRTLDDVEISQSGWVFVTSIAPWFIAITGGYYLHQYVPTFVAYGRTRLDSAIEAGLFGLTIAGLVALLATIGFVLERGLYSLAGWSRGEPDDLIFSSYNDVLAIFWAMLLTGLVWIAAGMAVGAAYYRDSSRGISMVIIAILLVTVSGTSGGIPGPFTQIASRFSFPSDTLVVTILSLLATVVLLVLGWRMVRDTPIRNK